LADFFPDSVLTAGLEPLVPAGCTALIGHTKLAVLWKRGRDVRTVTGAPARASLLYPAMRAATSWVDVGSAWALVAHVR
jgi:hypothetical protein